MGGSFRNSTPAAARQKLPSRPRQIARSLEIQPGTAVASSGPEARGMTMLRLTTRRREFLAEKLGDLANLAVGALVFGQAVGQDAFSVGVAAAGIAIWSVFTGFSLALKGEGR
jgi:hypothetical protein